VHRAADRAAAGAGDAGGPTLTADFREVTRMQFTRRNVLEVTSRAAMVMLATAAVAWIGAAPGSAQALPAEGVDRFITVNGLRIHYLDWGNESKTPFIMLHGISRTAHTFDHVARRYQKDYHVIAIDMRGHGESQWDPKAQYLVEDYVKAIEAIVQQLKLKNIVMIGNSTGGRVVQVLAGLHPELVSRIVVEDVGPERPASIASGFAQRVQQERAEDTSWASEDELFAQTKKQNPQVGDEVLRSYVKSAVKRRADGRFVWKRDPQLSKGFVVTELWQYIGKIKCPTIYILGGKSTIVPAETQERLKQTIPGVEIVTVAGAGHYPNWDKPAETFAILDRFLAGNRGARLGRAPVSSWRQSAGAVVESGGRIRLLT
jgi:esterase